MLSDKLLEKIFADEDIRKMSVSEQSMIANAIERVLEEVKEENPYASLSELLNANE